MEDCIFCKIAQGQIPSTFLYEDDQVIVINDINPQTPVHMLVLPKKHIQSLAAAQEEDRDLLGHMLMTAKNMARERGVAESGYRIIVNTGRDKVYIQSALNVDTETKKNQETFSLRNSGDFFRKIVIVDGNSKPWTDEDGIMYMGVIPFLLGEAGSII